MRIRWPFFILILLVMAFFLADFTANIYLTAVRPDNGGKKLKLLKIAHLLSPFDHEPAHRFAYERLKTGFENKTNEIILESIDWFKHALSRNPFHYYSHYYLGKAYLFHDYPNSRYFSEAIAEFKKAARIRGGNKTIALDTAKIMLSMWPLLSDDDRQFCTDILARSLDRFSWWEFAGVIEPWWLYSKDTGFTGKLLEKRPEFFQPAAHELIRLAAPLTLRWQYLCEYEKYLLQDIRRQYNSLPSQAHSRPAALIPLLEKLRAIKFYNRLAADKTFDENAYRELKNGLLYEIIAALLEEGAGGVDSYLDGYISGDIPREQVFKIKERLAREGFFKPNDFASLYYNYRLEYKLANYSDIISDIDRLKQSITLINEARRPGYIKLLLLLADSYEATKLLSVAEKTFREIIAMEPGNLDAVFGMKRIQQVIGVDAGYMRKIRPAVAALTDSGKIQLNAVNIRTTVYLLDNTFIEITIDEGLKEKIAGPGLIQVSSDGKIAYENYIAHLPLKFPVELKPAASAQEMSRHIVEIRVIN
jgi:hypothetical protein